MEESKRLAQEWARVTNQIKSYDGIDPSQINAFFSRLKPQAMSEGFLMLTADTDFIKTWIERHYASFIAQALKDLYGVDFTVLMEVDVNQSPEPQVSNAPQTQVNQQPQSAPQPSAPVQNTTQNTASVQQEAPTPQSNQSTGSSASSGFQAAVAQQTDPATHTEVESENVESDSSSPTSSLTFENYVVGASNRMAYSMAVVVAEEPGGDPSLNPLFLYGRSGLGKTHLLRAIQNYIQRNIPHLKCVYVDSSQMIDDYTDAALSHNYKEFKNRYESADVLLIDDVQAFQGKKQTLDMFFQIFNNLTTQGKQVILSADRAPKNIDIDQRYTSRFNSGVTIDILPPEFEVKLGIVKNFIREYKRAEGVEGQLMSDEVQDYIAKNSGSNIRELKSAVTNVIFQAKAFGKETLSLDEVKELLKNHFTGGATKKLTIADIQKQVEIYYKVSHADLIGKKRSRNIVYARQVAIYLSRHMLDLPFSYIGKSFGGKDHTTIMYSVTNIEEKMKENFEIHEELESIRQMILEA